MNQVIYNTNITLKTFKPIKNDSMLAIIEDNKFYRIYLHKYNNQCVASCPEGQKIILDSENGNFCGIENQQNCEVYLLIPYKICVKTCNISINTIIKEGSFEKCGLCKDFDISNPFKIYDKEGCLQIIPKGIFLLYEDLKIFENFISNYEECKNSESCDKCKDGFKYENGECIQETKICHSNCEDCTEFSNDDNNQKCISCQSGKLFYEDIKSCFDSCIERYYQNENKCLQCYKTCKKCQKGKENDNENCEECKSDDYYLLNSTDSPKNCVEACPDGFYTSGKFCNPKINGTIVK